jgi:1,4-dihydroxy-2-naphthoate octaprenyltransferase
MSLREPSLAALPNPVTRYFLATRPGFLTITVVGGLIGLASSLHTGLRLEATRALLTLLGALIAHAAVNVLNDYYDARNGTDARNEDRLYPYTGGSRFIQNGVLTLHATGVFGFSLLLCVILLGGMLAAEVGPGLVVIGAAGLFIGWAYSGEPLRLNSRGLGELAVAVGFLLVVVGTDFVQRGAFAPLPWLAGLPYALWVTAILYVNQFPDRRADAESGKRHWVVRLAPRQAAWGYGLILIVAYGVLLLGVALRYLPMAAAAAFAALPMSLAAFRHLLRHSDTPQALRPAIRMTLGAAHLGGLFIAAALWLTKGTP